MTKKIPDFEDPRYWNSTIRMSMSKFFILCALTERPLHGYDVTAEVEQRTQGFCSPGEGTIYPVLKQFAQGGYVTVHSETISGRVRKVYTITDRGRRAYNVGLAEWQKVTACLQTCCVAA
ncbi:MAG: PadR family transcriptional regulator [Pseudomonadota bacterium]